MAVQVALPRSQIRTLPWLSPEASHVPSGAIASTPTEPVWPVGGGRAGADLGLGFRHGLVVVSGGGEPGVVEDFGPARVNARATYGCP
ncbi:hypothetical protein OG438_45175 [Streptomyces sp. NBC_00035]